MTRPPIGIRAGLVSARSFSEERVRLVCVTGMHRSGTSLLARVINMLGVDLGPHGSLLDALPENPAGFWEHRGIKSLNDAVLDLLGGTWDAPPPLPDGWEVGAAFDPLRTRARAVLDQDLGAGNIAGWKDARTSLVLPFWRSVAHIDRTILTIRHPDEVVRSLNKRNGFSSEKGAQLWLRYVAAAWYHDPGHLLVTYEHFFTSFDATIEKLVDFLDLPTPGADVTSDIEAFFHPELRHHEYHQQRAEGPFMDLARMIFDLSLQDDRQRAWPALSALHIAFNEHAAVKIERESARRAHEDALRQLGALQQELVRTENEAHERLGAAARELAAVKRERTSERKATARQRRRADALATSYEHLRNRRSVRAALFVANLASPVFRVVRDRSIMGTNSGAGR